MTKSLRIQLSTTLVLLLYLITPLALLQEDLVDEIQIRNTEQLGDLFQFNMVEIDNSANTGMASSLGIDSAGNIHLAYLDFENNALSYATNLGGAWSTQIIDSIGEESDVTSEGVSLKIDSIDSIHISYIDYNNFNLKYATFDGISWTISTIDDSGSFGYSTSLALDSNGNPHVSYYEFQNYYLKYAKFDGTSWSKSTIDDSEYGDIGGGNSIAMTSSDNYRISYYHKQYTNMKVASYYSTSWSSSIYKYTVQSNGNVGKHSSIAITPENHHHLVYTDHSDNVLKYAYCLISCYGDDDWTIETVDASQGGNKPSIAVNSSGSVHISYHHNPSGTIKYAVAANYSEPWRTKSIGPSNGEFSSIAVDEDGTIHIAYQDGENENLVYAKHTPSDLDSDGYYDWDDLFPYDQTEWNDTDDDGVGDNSDRCEGFDDGIDVDLDGIVDGCDPLIDNDGDGVANDEDAFPSDPSETNDSDGDGVGDNSDWAPYDSTESVDNDDDGVGDNADAFPADASETVDSDDDGVGDNADAFPDDASETLDTDNDGVGDNTDVFPYDFLETLDSDGDGVGDNSDAFPDDASETLDSDGDGVGDNADAFPSDASERSDSDGDGVGDNSDAFSSVARYQSISDVLIDVGVAIGILAISLAVMLRVIRKKSSNDEEYELHSFVPEKELSETPLPPIQDTKAFVKNWQELPSGNWLDKDEKGIQWYLANDGNYWYSTDGGYALYSKE
ncbi:hypothetical protein N9M09_03995 [Candidatus Poseidoniales archaeon]|nr:hypothetical protein [Candidatus Poseidoniales archaeon]